jgi:predicted permease
LSNIKLGLRGLWKNPFVSSVAIVSLALGIGANTAIFSLFNDLILSSLPVQEPERLVNLGAPGPKPGSNSCNNAGGCEEVFSYPMFRDLEGMQTAFTGIAAHRTFGANLAYGGQTMSDSGTFVSGSYFPVLGLQPALGRLIGPGDDANPGESAVAVLSNGYWQSRFGGDPNILGETLIINGHPMTIIGVAPGGFEGTTLGTLPKVFVPITMRELEAPGFEGFDNRRSYWIYLFARLNDGVSIEQARAAINGQYSGILDEVEAPLQSGMSEQTMAQFRAKEITVVPGAHGQSNVRSGALAPLVLLYGVTALVLLIACANIANLLLARGAARSSEMAVRLSIGAGRGQLIGQLLTESCLLAAFGGVAGLLVARWTLDLIRSLLPDEASALIASRIDPPVLACATALALGTGVVFGIFPALNSTRAEVLSALKSQSGQPSGARSASRFRTALAVGQIALSMTLLVAAGLFARSLLNVSRVELGLDTEGIVMFGISPEYNGYAPEASRDLFQRTEEELAGLPGVTAVTASMVPLLSGNNWGAGVSVEGFEAGPDTDISARYNSIGAGYFRTLGIPLLSGREFTQSDAFGTPSVAIVNEEFARKFNLGREAVGKRMATSRTTDLDIEIVGLVQDAKYSEVKDEIPPQFFTPYRQDEGLGFLTFYVETASDTEQLLLAIPPLMSRLDPNLPVEELRTLQQQVEDNVFLDRFITVLATAFACLATLLAAVGLYGVLAYTVTQRTREIGLRVALGAAPASVRGLVLKQVAWMTLVGGVIGLAAAVALGRLAESMLYELRGHDITVLVSSAVILAAVALGAGFIPAHRASRLDAMQALRTE